MKKCMLLLHSCKEKEEVKELAESLRRYYDKCLGEKHTFSIKSIKDFFRNPVIEDKIIIDAIGVEELNKLGEPRDVVHRILQIISNSLNKECGIEIYLLTMENADNFKKQYAFYGVNSYFIKLLNVCENDWLSELKKVIPIQEKKTDGHDYFIKKEWDFSKIQEREIESIKSNKYIRWNILVIDDELKDNSTEGNKLFEIIEEILNRTFCKSKEEPIGVFKEDTFDEKKIENLLHKIPDIDIVLLDIVESNNGSKLAGIEKVLPYLTRFRGVYKFPLIIMLSRLDFADIAHVAFREGADYYFPKKHFFYQLPRSLEEVVLYVLKKQEKEEEFKENKIREILMKFSKKAFGKESNPEIIYKFTSGKSGGWVGLVRLQLKEKGITKGEIFRIIKIDTKTKLYKEKYNYDTYIKGYIDNFCGRIEDPIIPLREKALIAYTVVGIPYEIKNQMSFTDFVLSEKDFNKIENAVEWIYRRILRPIHNIVGENNGNKDIREFYRQLLPPYGEMDLLWQDEGDIYTFELQKIKKEENEIEAMLIKPYNEEKANNYRNKDLKFCANFIIKDNRGEICTHILARRGKRITLRLNEAPDATKIYKTFIKQIKEIENKIKEFCKYQDIPKEHNGKEKELIKINENENRYEIFGEFLPNPIYWFKHKFEKNSEFREIVKNITFHYSVIHGDLQPENIVVTKDVYNRYNFWLIDFADTGVGHLAYDFTKMEVQLRLMIISDVLYNTIMHRERTYEKWQEAVKFWIECERDLLYKLFSPITRGHAHKVWCGNRDIEDLCLLLKKIHLLGKEAGLNEMEYLISLFYVSLNALKYKDEVNPIKRISAPLPRILILITASVICEIFENLVNINKIKEFMRLAVKESEYSIISQGKNYPKVGAVLVKEGKVILKSHKEGKLHAEQILIRKAEERKINLKECELYVTLEPCCTRHIKGEKSCSDLIIEKGIKRVYIGCADPNPRIKYKGINYLMSKNVDVKFVKSFEEEIKELNKEFFQKKRVLIFDKEINIKEEDIKKLEKDGYLCKKIKEDKEINDIIKEWGIPSEDCYLVTCKGGKIIVQSPFNQDQRSQDSYSTLEEFMNEWCSKSFPDIEVIC